MDVRALGARLQRQDEQEAVLHRLLRLAAGGHDVTDAAPAVVRHILSTSAAKDPALLSPAYDLLIATPSNPNWVDTLASLAKSLSVPTSPVFLVALSTVPSLPHPALAHLALVAAPSIAGVLSARPPTASPRVRVAAVAACAALALRERPATAPPVDALRVDPLSPAQLLTVRAAVEHALSALVSALDDPSHAPALAALDALTTFAASADAVPQSSVLRATKEATAAAIWDLVLPRAPRVAGRLINVVVPNAVSESDASDVPPVQRRPASVRLHERRASLRALARIAARALSGASLRGDGSSLPDAPHAEAHAAAEAAATWAVSWVDRVLAPSCDDEDWHVASSAASALLMVCSYCSAPAIGDKRARWGARASSRLARILGEHSSKMSALLATALTKDAFRALAALSKEPQVTAKFVVSTSVALLPHAAACPRVSDRLEALVVIASTVVEFDLRGTDANPGTALKAVTGSSAWSEIVASSIAISEGDEDGTKPEDSATAAELVCCFGQSMLEASRKIVSVKEPRMREGLMSTWADMLAKLLQRTAVCLSWPYSSASSFAKEMFLKMFEALGQYSSYLTRTRGIGMEEYERLQELLVAAALKQEDANTRAALLLCVTKYWIASALKAEANAGHVLKAIWRHAQESYRDEELTLNELRTGVMWGDARAGDLTPAQRATAGGYVSTLTALSKRTRAVIDTVGSTFTEVLETAFFGSIALATAALEGSTLTTDFAYSSLASLLALVHRNPTHAEKAIEVARNYLNTMERAESADLLVFEAVRNTIAGLEMYLDEFFPKPVPVRPDMAMSAQRGWSGRPGTPALQLSDPHSWLAGVSESCVFATSRLDDMSKESVAVSAEEAVLRASSVSRVRLRALHPGTLHNREHGVNEATQGNQQTLSGASDPCGVTAWHAMDTVKALATLHVDIVNRSAFHITNLTLCYSAGGALTPLPDAATEHILGSLSLGASTSQRVTLAVRHNQGYAGRIQLSVHVRQDGNDSQSENATSFAEQACLPYYIPSSDVLLLRSPAPSAGVDVFRRRWDLMREACSFHVLLRKDQDLDGFVDTLERRSRCLREVGRMRVSSHVSAMVADSSRGDYIALAALAPEARGDNGAGPCLIYATIRSKSAAYSRAFRNECRDWLSSHFKVIVLDAEPNQSRKVKALRPQDAYFSNEDRGMTDYQRWRAAHAARMACS